MIKTSEYCAVGHPDRMCDYIASYILDRYLENDKDARVAIEVQLKDTYATVSGEITSSCFFSDKVIHGFVRDAIRRIGYTDAYQSRFGEENTISADDVTVTLHLSRQSQDIAQGVDGDGWGDQGIFWGMAVNDPSNNFMPLDYVLARTLAQRLAESRLGGLDIKTQVTVENGKVIEVVVAIPLVDDGAKTDVEKLIREIVPADAVVTINGTGRYVKHGPVGDCGTTGRKLVVDFYGGNAKIGGGSPWGKDPSKADVTLNILARMKALEFMRRNNFDEVHCAISCCIGKPEIRVSYFDAGGRLIETKLEKDPPSHVIDSLGLRYHGYADRCAEGLFGRE